MRTTPTRPAAFAYNVAQVGHLARRLRAGALVVLESTAYPGTTDELVRPLLEQSGLRSGQEFFVGYSPERIDPGKVLDYETDLDGIGDAYAAMDDRRAIKSLVRAGTL